MRKLVPVTFCAVAVAAIAAGCGKSEQGKSDTAPDQVTAPAVQQPMSASNTPIIPSALPTNGAAMQTNAGAARAQGLSMAAVASNQLSAAQATVNNQVQQLLAKGQTLLSEGKYQEAMSVANQLYATGLTPEQHKLVDSYKAQIQAALVKRAGTNAASAVGNLFRK